MDDHSSDTFANRDEPLPLLTVSFDDLDDTSSEADSSSESRSQRFRRRVSASRIREKAQDLHAVTSEKVASSPGKPSIQDRLFNKLLEQVIPIEDYDELEEESKKDRRSSKYVARPAFSLGTMSTNFRRFNARIGIVFVFQNEMIRLFTWRTATHTLSFLAVYTFVCLDPYLLLALPLAIAILFIMVPAFITRHPPPPPPPKAASVRTDQISAYSYTGPAMAPARTIKPAPETSKDFFRNMRDLQNCMADFSNMHDALVHYVAPATNFSDEVYSSMVFLYLFILTCLLFISAHLIPFRFIFLISGWLMTISGHPRAQIWLAKQHRRAERKAALYSDSLQIDSGPNLTNQKRAVPTLYGLPIPNNKTTRAVQSTVSKFSEITLDTAPETAEVEIFELQHRPLLPINTPQSRSANPRATEWQPHLFTAMPFDPLSPHRISGSRPSGTRFFEDVQPPPGWAWHTPKWELDLEAGEWVSDRLIVGVEYDVIHQGAALDAQTRRESINADFGGWVWDLPPPSETKSGLERDDEVWLAYGDYNFADLEDREKAKKLQKKKKEKKDGQTDKDWEEQIKFGSRGRTGEWRRRRWVRVVRRKAMVSHD